MPGVTYYQVLGVDPDATAAELRRAYLGAARRHHPDLAGTDVAKRASAERQMQRVNQAWAVLGDPARRRDYDDELRMRRAQGRRAPDPPSGRDAGERAPYGRAERAPSGASVDFVPYYDGEEVDPAELLDDTPIDARPVPRWVQVLPPALVVAALVALVFGLVAQFPPFLAVGVLLLSVATVSFLIAPIIALSRSGRGR